MNRTEIIHIISKDGEFKSICQITARATGLQNDLYQELMMMIFEMPEQKLVKLYENNELKAYCARSIWLMHNSPTNPFFKKFRSVAYGGNLGEEISIERLYGTTLNERLKLIKKIEIEVHPDYEIARDKAIHQVKQQIKESYWYQQKVLELYIKYKSFKKLSQATGIPQISLKKTIYELRKQIKQKVQL